MLYFARVLHVRVDDGLPECGSLHLCAGNVERAASRGREDVRLQGPATAGQDACDAAGATVWRRGGGTPIPMVVC